MMFIGRPRRGTLLAPVFLLFFGGNAFAGCFPVAQANPKIIPVSVVEGATLQITYLGHSSFLIESAAGVTAVTDYNGTVRAAVTPDIVTMNNAHPTHFTDLVEPGVEFILPRRRTRQAKGGFLPKRSRRIPCPSRVCPPPYPPLRTRCHNVSAKRADLRVDEDALRAFL